MCSSDLNKPYVQEKLFLAGGLNVQNLRDALKLVNPYAVDVASGVESQPGLKDLSLVRRFVEEARRSSDGSPR